MVCYGGGRGLMVSFGFMASGYTSAVKHMLRDGGEVQTQVQVEEVPRKV